MKIIHIIEGGWTSDSTQDTVITPITVKQVLPVVSSFINDVNNWLNKQSIPSVKIGSPVGSTAYFNKDTDDTEYGDIDLQMIAPNIPEKNDSQVGAIYNSLIDKYILENKPQSIYDTGGKANGHPIFKVGEDFIQVDFIWATEKFANWSQHRMTPAHKIKGAVHGSMFSSFGDIMDISIQGAGAKIKIKDGEAMPYGKTRNYDSLDTITHNIETFGIDIVNYMFEKMKLPGSPKFSQTLQLNPGLKTDKITSEQLASVIKGVAESFEINEMYGKFNLSSINDRNDFISKFVAHFANKMKVAASSKKFDKAKGKVAKANAQATKDKLLHGIEYIQQLMN